jgi:hypothetical protein
MRSSRKKSRLIIVLMAALAVIVIAGYLYLQNANYRSALDTTKQWARLSDFPSSATNVRVKTSGSMFTREFTVTFRAPLEDIDSWLQESPGTAESTPKADGSIRRFTIKPGGGAQHAELEVDDDAGLVRINVWWS